MNAVRTVLISGCSIAGPVLAYWLARHGFTPTIVERASAPRPGGQAIDVRGKGVEVLDRMGLLETVRAARTTLKGVSMQDRDGAEIWRSEEMTLTGGQFESDDIEILRDDLLAILVEAAAGAEIIYGDTISTLAETPQGVEVQFRSGGSRRFDLVIGADGIHSNVRRLVFGDEAPFLHELGMAIAIFSAPNVLGLADWQIVHQGEDYIYGVYTARQNRQLRVLFAFPAGVKDECQGDVEAQKALVAAKAADFGWEVPRLLQEMNAAPDFYFGAIAQVRMEHWSRGRVALVGDAAYCPSPRTGQGTSLALVGAYVLAAELAQAPDNPSEAFTRYEARMRPFVDANQALVNRDSRDLSPPPAREQAKNAIEL